MEKLSIFNQELTINNFLCSNDPKNLMKCYPSLRLFIKLNDECNAKCKFCVNETSCDYGQIDFSKLEYIIHYLKERNILHSIGITGGEPNINPDKLNYLINMLFKIDSKFEIQINTNGINLSEMSSFDHVNDLESIHISRHHYDDLINYEIFGSKNIASTQSIYDFQDKLIDKKIININTMIMKGYIDSLKEIRHMLDSVGDLKVYKNGFVALIKCNEYSKKHFINFNNIFNNLDSDFYLGHHFYRQSYCECIDGMYLTNHHKLVEFYARMIKNTKEPYTNQLVYTSDNRLTAGFTGKVLYK